MPNSLKMDRTTRQKLFSVFEDNEALDDIVKDRTNAHVDENPRHSESSSHNEGQSEASCI